MVLHVLFNKTCTARSVKGILNFTYDYPPGSLKRTRQQPTVLRMPTTTIRWLPYEARLLSPHSLFNVNCIRVPIMYPIKDVLVAIRLSRKIISGKLTLRPGFVGR